MTIWFSQSNEVDKPGVLITTDSEETQLPVANLAQRQVYKIWRTEADTAYFRVDFLQNVTIDVVSIVTVRNNDPNATFTEPLGETDTLTHQFDADGGTPWAGALHDSGSIQTGIKPGYGYHIYKLSSPISARYWECTITATSRAGDGFFDVGRAWAGAILSPQVNFAPGFLERWLDDSVVSRAARSRGEFVDRGSKARQWSGRLEGLYDSEFQNFTDMQRQIGISDQMLVGQVETGDLARKSMLARFESVPGISQIGSDRYRMNFSLIESR